MTLRLNGSNSGFTEVKAPATAGSNTLILPTSNGSANQYLRNGSTAGTLEFGALPTRVKRTYTSETVYASGDTEVEFTGIPANFSRLRLIMRGLSLSGTNDSFGSALGTSSTQGDGSSTAFVVRAASTNVRLDGFIELCPNQATSPTRLY